MEPNHHWNSHDTVYLDKQTKRNILSFLKLAHLGNLRRLTLKSDKEFKLDKRKSKVLNGLVEKILDINGLYIMDMKRI